MRAVAGRPAYLTRRELALGAGALGGAGALSGCAKCFSPTFEPGHPIRNKGARTFTLRIPFSGEKGAEIHELLDNAEPFPYAYPGIHFARFATLPDNHFTLMCAYDRNLYTAINFLARNADGIDPVFEGLEGYPARGARDRNGMWEFIERYQICTNLWYRAYRMNQAQILQSIDVRDGFLDFLQRLDEEPHQLPYHYEWFLAELGDIGSLRRKRPKVAQSDEGEDHLLARLPDRTQPFTMQVDLKGEKLGCVLFKLRAGNSITNDTYRKPLRKLDTLHFARVSVLEEQKKLIFASVYDGDFMQYVEDFGSKVAKEIDQIFGEAVGYPKEGAKDAWALRDFLLSRQVDTWAFATGYLNRTVQEIQASQELARALARFTSRVKPRTRRLQSKVDHFVHRNQEYLS